MPSINDLIEAYKKRMGIEEMDLTPQAEVSLKKIITIYGTKGVGKTSLAYSFPGTIATLSFDKKSLQIKNNMYDNDPRIAVHDCIQYLNEDFEEYTVSSSVCYMNADQILDKIGPEGVDWVVLDALEVLTTICEMYMRFRNGLTPFQGISNMNVWKERRLLIRNIHNKALRCAKKGVIYTTYVKNEEEESGGQVTVVSRPSWMDVIMLETDVVIQIIAQAGQGKMRYVARIVSSKDDKWIQTGKVFDITSTNGKGVKSIITVAKKEMEESSANWGDGDATPVPKPPLKVTNENAEGGFVPAVTSTVPKSEKKPKVKKEIPKEPENLHTKAPLADVPNTVKPEITTGTAKVAGVVVKTESKKEVKSTEDAWDW